jgi:hypothetical protein
MAVSVVPEVADLVVDPLTGCLDGVLASLADGVAERTDLGEVPDAVRIDRICRLEKLKGAVPAAVTSKPSLAAWTANATPSRSPPPATAI